jgi:eukaryotic translation initiation factor 2C
MPVISALSVILAASRNRSAGDGVVLSRNKFFCNNSIHPSSAEAPVSIGGGLQAWRGFYSSIRPAHKSLMVNVNLCTTAFYAVGNLAERMMEFMNASFGARPSAFARGVRVKTIHLGYKRTVKTVADINATQCSFNAEGMGHVTVQAYFQQS